MGCSGSPPGRHQLQGNQAELCIHQASWALPLELGLQQEQAPVGEVGASEAPEGPVQPLPDSTALVPPSSRRTLLWLHHVAARVVSARGPGVRTAGNQEGGGMERQEWREASSIPRGGKSSSTTHTTHTQTHTPCHIHGTHRRAQARTDMHTQCLAHNTNRMSHGLQTHPSKNLAGSPVANSNLLQHLPAPLVRTSAMNRERLLCACLQSRGRDSCVFGRRKVR